MSQCIPWSLSRDGRRVDATAFTAAKPLVRDFGAVPRPGARRRGRRPGRGVTHPGTAP